MSDKVHIRFDGQSPRLELKNKRGEDCEPLATGSETDRWDMSDNETKPGNGFLHGILFMEGITSIPVIVDSRRTMDTEIQRRVEAQRRNFEQCLLLQQIRGDDWKQKAASFPVTVEELYNQVRMGCHCDAEYIFDNHKRIAHKITWSLRKLQLASFWRRLGAGIRNALGGGGGVE